MALEDVFSYFKTYDKSSYLAVTCQGNEPTDAELAVFETEVGFRMPEEFREFTLSPLGGLYLEVREEVWRRAKIFDAGPFWTFLYGIKVFGIADEIPDWLDIRVRKQGYKNGLVPFLQVVGDPDCYCFESTGRIVKWSHQAPEELEAVELTFSELLLREIAELEVRKHCKVNNIGLLEYRSRLTGKVCLSSRVDVFLERKPSSLSTLLKIKKAFNLETSMGELKKAIESAPCQIVREITYIQAIRRCLDVGLEEGCLGIRLSGESSRVLPIDVDMIASVKSGENNAPSLEA